MATINVSVSLTDAQQTTVQRVLAYFQHQIAVAPVPLRVTPPATAKDTVQMMLNNAIATYASRFTEDDKVSIREAFQKASQADQDAVKAILAKYQ